jgi:predicted MPP superfamily phosphohydrolase
MQMPNKYLSLTLGITLLTGGFFWLGYANEIFSFQKIDVVSSHPFETIKIGVINDLHAEAVQKKGEEMRLRYDYQRPLADFFRITNQFEPKLVVINGDIIDGTRQKPEIAIEELGFVKKSFDQNFSVPKFWTIGNHELRAVNREQWKEGLGIAYTDYAYEDGAYKFIFLDSAFGSGGVGNDVEGAVVWQSIGLA